LRINILLPIIILLISCTEKKHEAFNLNNIPKDWVRLTEKDGNWIIYNSCESGNLLLTISKDDCELLLHGQQEDYKFMILESSKINDTILINTKWKDADEKQLFKFYWADKSRSKGIWTTTYPNGNTAKNIFTERDKQKNYNVISQPCRECWGDECDEIEKE
jgi:hypothetical protein